MRWMHGLGSIIVAVSCLTAQAQTDPANSAYTTNPAAAGQQAEQGTIKRVVPIGTLVQNSGGSLARAQMATRPDSAGAASPTDAGPSAVSFFAVPEQKPKLLRKHDLVTIVVREDSSFSSNGTTTQQKSADFDAQIADFIQFKPSNMSVKSYNPNNPIEIKSLGTRDFSGQGAVSRDDSLTAQITAEVVDVKPNGTLVLQASQTIKTDEEEQQMVLVGTCRVQDITADNSILSTQLFDKQLSKMHRGVVRDTQTRGFFPRLLDIINPF